MSRQAHLPPRCPFQRKNISGCNPVFPTLSSDTPLRPRHQKSVSQSSIAEEKPDWLDDLLDEPDSNSCSSSHRRSASDSLTLFNNLVPLTSLSQLSARDNSTCVCRHRGQRSRVRKLQYIAELERTVDILQKVETDMASKVASLLQQRLALSLENNKLAFALSL